jgi:mono/diheme cytochrome c family protein
MGAMMKAMVPAALLAVAISVPAFAQGDAPSGAAGGGAAPPAGEQLYRTVCAACHMQDARGGGGAAVIPALAGNPKLGIAAYPITIVLMGKGAMPGFSDVLKPQQIAQVITYVRTSFGNSYPKPVTEAEVLAIAATKPHR